MECLSENEEVSPTGRRTNKPMVERRRRERINRSLDELKSLILNSLNKDVSDYSKMEKADILEMTVNHVRSAMNKRLKGVPPVAEVSWSIYQAGFRECASEVFRYLSVQGTQTDTVKSRLGHHLSGYMRRPPINFSPISAHHNPFISTAPPQSAFVDPPQTTSLSSLPGAPMGSPPRRMDDSMTREGVYSSNIAPMTSNISPMTSPVDQLKHSQRSAPPTPPASPPRHNVLHSQTISPRHFIFPDNRDEFNNSNEYTSNRVHPTRPVAINPIRNLNKPLKRLQHRPIHVVAASGASSMWRPW